MHKILSILLLGVSITASAKSDVVMTAFPELAQGLNIPNIERCVADVGQHCQNHALEALLDCASQTMGKAPFCKQNKVFLTNERALIRSVKEYGNIGLVYASVAAADHSDGYFMVDTQGNIITPRGFMDISKAKNYAAINAKHPKADVWPRVMAPPTYKQLADGKQGLTFQQMVLNGCHACEQAGLAKVTYIFSKEGKFIEATVDSLVPNLDDKPLAI